MGGGFDGGSHIESNDPVGGDPYIETNEIVDDDVDLDNEGEPTTTEKGPIATEEELQSIDHEQSEHSSYNQTDNEKDPVEEQIEREQEEIEEQHDTEVQIEREQEWREMEERFPLFDKF